MIFNSVEEKINGMMVAYYVVCKRKLWLFSHGLGLEKLSDYVEIGKLISESFFKKEKLKEVEFGNIKVDFIKVKGEIIINEVKKSKKLEEAHIWQTKFYIYRLKKLGLECNKGVIHYPKLLRKIEVELKEEDIKMIEEAERNIKNIKSLDKPPEVINQPYCKRCAYFELCYI